MSDSPQSASKEVVEQGAPSDNDQEANDMDPNDPHGQWNDFEVKEQDRWLPIANGMLRSPNLSASLLC
jgi:nuclear transcription Y subunit beta